MTRPSPFAAALWSALEAGGGRPFWITPRRALRYRRFAALVRRAVTHFDGAGLEPGDRVLIVTPDDQAAAATWIAAVLHALVPVMPAPGSGAERLAAIALSVAPGLALLSGAGADAFPRAAFPCLTPTDLRDAPDEAAPRCQAPDDDLAYILFTSGSTNTPKGVRITHDNLAAQFATLTRLLRVGPQSRIFNNLVLHHADGMIQGPLLAAYTGATLLRPGRFSIARLAEDLAWQEVQRSTHLVASPTLLDLVLRAAPGDDLFRRPDFVCVISSAAPLQAALWDRFENRFGVPIVNEYGMTETVAASHFAGGLPGMGARHTIGRPIDCEARIVDPEGRPAPEGETGALQLRGRCIFAGYHDDPGRTARSFEDGWLVTGDLARLTPEGDTILAGRQGNVINSGGFLIQPEEIDEVVSALEGIDEVLTVGVEDDAFGEVAVTAYVSESGLDPKAVLAHCRRHLEPLKVPKRAVRLAAIRKSEAGKPVRAAVASDVATAAVAPAGGGGLFAIAAEVFAVPADSLHDDSSPETTPGWDSYAHTALVLAIEEAFSVELPTADAMAATSLGRLRRLVARLSSPDPAAGASFQRLRPGSGAGTLAGLPGLGGLPAHALRLMPHVADGVGILGARLGEVDGTGDPAAVVPGIADALARDLLGSEPARPLVLFGLSFGGYLAFECAAVLERLGAPADGVVLIDTAVPAPQRPTTLRDAEFAARRIKSRLAQAVRPDPASGNEPDGEVVVIPGYGRLDLSVFPPENRPRARLLFEAGAVYRPSTIQTPLLVVAAEARFGGFFPSPPDLGWGRFDSGPVETACAGASHLSVLHEDDAAAEIGARISAFVETRRARSARRRA